jgi:hypothetical protein
LRVIGPYEWEETEDVKVFPEDGPFLKWLAYAIIKPSVASEANEVSKLELYTREMKRLAKNDALLLKLRPRPWSSRMKYNSYVLLCWPWIFFLSGAILLGVFRNLNCTRCQCTSLGALYMYVWRFIMDY